MRNTHEVNFYFIVSILTTGQQYTFHKNLKKWHKNIKINYNLFFVFNRLYRSIFSLSPMPACNIVGEWMDNFQNSCRAANLFSIAALYKDIAAKYCTSSSDV